jgi:hypothetical protein
MAEAHSSTTSITDGVAARIAALEARVATGTLVQPIRDWQRRQPCRRGHCVFTGSAQKGQWYHLHRWSID